MKSDGRIATPPAPLRRQARGPGAGRAAGTDSPWRPAAERARERAAKREAVIRAAARAFRARGFHNTSLEDVAADLNVTKPTIYSYVGSKEQLLFECFVAGVDRIRAAFDESARGAGTARARLFAVVHGYAAAITSEFGWCMVRAEELDLSPAMSERIKGLKSEIDQGLRRLIREGVADGSIRPCDPKMTAFALAGALNWIAHWHRESAGLSPAQIADRFLDVFGRGLEPRPPAPAGHER